MALGTLPSATWVDETLLSETDRAIVIRFGRAGDPLCQQADAQLREAADELVLVMHAFTVDLDAVPDFTAMYELHDSQHGHTPGHPAPGTAIPAPGTAIPARRQTELQRSAGAPGGYGPLSTPRGEAGLGAR